MFIVSFRNRNKDFWSIMAHYFANKEVRKELPYIIDEKDKIWVIGFKNKEDIIGFLSYKIFRGTVTISNCYVNTTYRKNGHFKKLILYTLAKLENEKKIKLTITNEYAGFFEKLGFCESYRKGNYTVMIKEG